MAVVEYGVVRYSYSEISSLAFPVLKLSLSWDDWLYQDRRPAVVSSPQKLPEELNLILKQKALTRITACEDDHIFYNGRQIQPGESIDLWNVPSYRTVIGKSSGRAGV